MSRFPAVHSSTRSSPSSLPLITYMDEQLASQSVDTERNLPFKPAGRMPQLVQCSADMHELAARAITSSALADAIVLLSLPSSKS